jgi:TldD protein
VAFSVLEEEGEATARKCIELANSMGASYADVRLMETRNRIVSAEPGFSFNESRSGYVGSRLTPVDSSTTSFGMRVIVDGLWGFFGILGNISNASIRAAVKRAVKIAKLSAKNSKGKVKLTAEKSYVENYRNPIEENPFEMSDSDLQDLLVSSVKQLQEVDSNRNALVRSASCALHMFEERKLFESSEGSCINQRIIGCGALLVGSIQKNGRVFRRSYPRTLGPNFATKGFEHIRSCDLVGSARRIRSELFQLQEAKPCPSEKLDLIIEGDLLAIQIHETIGHPTELDRATDVEWDFAGSTFLTPEKLNNFRFGAPHVNAVADATTPGGPGTFAYDDEGVKASKVDLIKEGMFVGYQTSRERAADLDLAKSSGAMRAVNAANLPLIRMTNINLLPGDRTCEEMIEETRHGILMTAPTMEIFDQRRRKFIFGAEIGWMIEQGEVTEVVYDTIYEGKTTDFWLNCDSIAKDRWGPVGTGCGKGRPHQTARVGHFCSQAKFKNVSVGAR